MSSPTLLLVNEQPIDFKQAVSYLQKAGRFQEFLLDILCQHALMEEVRSQNQASDASQDNSTLSAATIEQHMIDFRTKNGLIDSDDFKDWLASSGMTHETFREQLIWDLTLKSLKNQISQTQLDEYFQKRKPSLDQVVLSWIGVETEKRAKNLRWKLDWGTPFNRLVAPQATSDDDDSGLEIPLSWEEIPEALLDAMETAQTGAVIGPLLLDDRWYVFQVDAFEPAELDAALATQLKDELFEQWLAEKVRQMTVTLQLN
jgi:parvulin-like peptidyl-prolyl isomerase